LESLGSFLKEKRKASGVSLEQVSAEIRIKLAYLEALEEERYELLPAPLYKKIFVKAYADYLGLNFEELTKRFFEKKAESETTEKGRAEPYPEIVQTEKKSNNHLLVWAGIILGLVIILIFVIKKGPDTFFHNKVSGPKVEEARMNLPSTAIDSVKSESESLGKKEVREVVSQPEEMTLRLEGTEKCWALVIGDGDTLFSGFINNGMKFEYKARNFFKLTLGRAWAVKGYLNGKRLKPFGPKGKGIFGREINKDNYQDFLETAEGER
jgi:transcriptional regulator with XRE-family HTH domain